jgi:hypothetical protein
MAGPHDYSKRVASEFLLRLNQRGGISRTACALVAAFAVATLAALRLAGG